MKAAVFLNSGLPVEREVNSDVIICADGGYNFCPLRPDYIVGDGDSINEFPEGVTYIRHEAHKNFTDGESAVALARRLRADEIDFYGVLGGRYDHTLGNFSTMALADSFNIKAVARESGLDIFFAKGKFELKTKPGDIISVIPYGGEMLVSDYSGLEYPLINLKVTSLNVGRSVSNVATADNITLDISAGKALVFHYFGSDK